MTERLADSNELIDIRNDAERLLARLLAAHVINFPDDAPGADEAWSMGYEHGLYATHSLHLSADEVAMVRRLRTVVR